MIVVFVHVYVAICQSVMLVSALCATIGVLGQPKVSVTGVSLLTIVISSIRALISGPVGILNIHQASKRCFMLLTGKATRLSNKRGLLSGLRQLPKPTFVIKALPKMSNGSRPRILVSNDDGINAPGIRALIAALVEQNFADVLVCAPSGERSAQSHAITLGRYMSCAPAEVPGAIEAYAVDGTPADSVMLAMHSPLLKVGEAGLEASTTHATAA